MNKITIAEFRKECPTCKSYDGSLCDAWQENILALPSKKYVKLTDACKAKNCYCPLGLDQRYAHYMSLVVPAEVTWKSIM